MTLPITACCAACPASHQTMPSHPPPPRPPSPFLPQYTRGKSTCTHKRLLTGSVFVISIHKLNLSQPTESPDPNFPLVAPGPVHCPPRSVMTSVHSALPPHCPPAIDLMYAHSPACRALLRPCHTRWSHVTAAAIATILASLRPATARLSRRLAFVSRAISPIGCGNCTPSFSLLRATWPQGHGRRRCTGVDGKWPKMRYHPRRIAAVARPGDCCALLQHACQLNSARQLPSI